MPPIMNTIHSEKNPPINPDIQIYNKIPRNRAGLRTKLMAGAAAVALTLGISNYLEAGGSKTSVKAQTSQVFDIIPEYLQCSAMTKSHISTSAYERPRAGVVGKIPILGSLRRLADQSNGFSSDFSGEVDTMACFKATGVSIKIENNPAAAHPNNSAPLINVEIPASAAEFSAAINEAEAETVPGEGVLAASAKFEGSLTSMISQINHLKYIEAGLGQLAREEAVDDAVSKCGPAAWAQTSLAAEAGYKRIIEGEYNAQSAANNNLRPLDPNLIQVKIDGTPQFNPPYELNFPKNTQQNTSAKLDGNTGCIVPQGLYRPANLGLSTPINVKG